MFSVDSGGRQVECYTGTHAGKYYAVGGAGVALYPVGILVLTLGVLTPGVLTPGVRTPGVPTALVLTTLAQSLPTPVQESFHWGPRWCGARSRPLLGARERHRLARGAFSSAAGPRRRRGAAWRSALGARRSALGARRSA